MNRSVRRWLWAGAAAGLVAAGFLGAGADDVRAQGGGFEAKVIASATGEELSRQPGLWVCEVSFKPMRLMRVELTDPKTGEKKRELVAYVCYKAINRPLGEKKAADTDPVNDYDKPPGKSMFVPEFTLLTSDNGKQAIYHDVVLPEAQEAILKVREQRKQGGPRYRNSVEIIGPVPEPTDAQTAPGKTLWGVAVFRGVDPEADSFSIYMTGFSNGYKIAETAEGEEPLILRRTIRQDYWRPGDGIDLNEAEFRLKGDPVWEYRPDDVASTAGVEAIDGGPAKKGNGAKANGDAPEPENKPEAEKTEPETTDN